MKSFLCFIWCCQKHQHIHEISVLKAKNNTIWKQHWGQHTQTHNCLFSSSVNESSTVTCIENHIERIKIQMNESHKIQYHVFKFWQCYFISMLLWTAFLKTSRLKDCICLKAEWILQTLLYNIIEPKSFWNLNNWYNISTQRKAPVDHYHPVNCSHKSFTSHWPQKQPAGLVCFTFATGSQFFFLVKCWFWHFLLVMSGSLYPL